MTYHQRSKLQGRVNGRVMYYGGLCLCGVGLIGLIACGGLFEKPLTILLMGVVFAFVGKRFAMWGDQP